MCLPQGHNAVPLVKLNPDNPQPQVLHSTTELLKITCNRLSIPCDDISDIIWVSTTCYCPLGKGGGSGCKWVNIQLISNY